MVLQLGVHPTLLSARAIREMSVTHERKLSLKIGGNLQAL